MTLVERVRTPVAMADLGTLLDAAHHQLRGFGLTSDAYRIAAAQLVLEHGTASPGPQHPGITVPSLWAVWCFNLGNHDATAADRADPEASLFGTSLEREVGPSGDYKQRHVRRAYLDALDGMVGYWTCLLDGFEAAYYAIESGSAAAFAAALKSRGYYTQPEVDYSRGLAQIAAGL